MRILLAILTLALTACATSPAPAPLQALGGMRITGTATATLWGPWETEIAFQSGAITATAKQAERQIKAGRLSASAAASIEALLSKAEDALKASRRGSLTAPADAQIEAMAESRRLTTLAKNLLEP